MSTRDMYKPLFGNPITGWRTWFAWYPVNTVDAGWVWLRSVYWRRVAKHNHLDGGGPDLWWQYALDLN